MCVLYQPVMEEKQTQPFAAPSRPPLRVVFLFESTTSDLVHFHYWLIQNAHLSPTFISTNKQFICFSFLFPLETAYGSCIIKNLMKSIFRPQHQSTSKDFNQIGKKFGEKFNHRFGFGFGLSSGCYKYKNFLK